MVHELPPQLTKPMTHVPRSAEQLEAEEQAQRDMERLRLIREKRCAPPRSCSLFCPASRNELDVSHDCLKWVPTRQQQARCRAWILAAYQAPLSMPCREQQRQERIAREGFDRFAPTPNGTAAASS